MSIAVFDTETTGVNVHEDRIVQLFLGIYDDNGEVQEQWEWLMDPGIDIPTEASDIHGFTTEMIRGKVPPSERVLREVRDVFLKYTNTPWSAFNLAFDLSILDAEFKRHGVTETFGTYARDNIALLDALVIDRAKDRYRKGRRTLEAMAGHYGIPFDSEQAHNASYDVAVTAKVTLAVTGKYGVPSTQEQTRWYFDWAKGFQDYLRREDPDATVNGDWPLKQKED